MTENAKCIFIFSLLKNTLPGSSGVFSTDGSTTDVPRTTTGVFMTDLLFLSFTGVLYISEIPENKRTDNMRR